MIDRDLKCSCNRFAYADAFSGEYGENGYTCSSCLEALNAKVVEQWHKNHEENRNFVTDEQRERGFADLNRMINPLIKLGNKP